MTVRNLDPAFCLMTLGKIVENEGDLSALTEGQNYYVKNIIGPLVSDGFCEVVKYYLKTGYLCHGDVYIDDGYLSQCYMDSDFICHACDYDEEINSIS